MKEPMLEFFVRGKLSWYNLVKRNPKNPPQKSEKSQKYPRKSQKPQIQDRLQNDELILNLNYSTTSSDTIY